MPLRSTIPFLVLSTILVYYLFYSIRYSLVFRKNIIITGKAKCFHLIMIWVIPFFWIMLLKAMLKPVPGSHKMDNKNESIPFSDGNDALNAANISDL